MFEDPRLEIIRERMKEISRIIVIASGKGGVGKSVVATCISLILAENNLNVGLLDLDFQAPSCHMILGARKIMPREEYGIIPPEVWRIKLMSIVFYTQNRPLAIRGKEITDAIIELLAITRWGNLNYLIIDMPPGISNEILDLIRLIRNLEVLLVSTSSSLAIQVVSKLARILIELEIPIIGIIENMQREPNEKVKNLARSLSIKYLGSIPYDPSIEEAIGHPDVLLRTRLAESLKEIVRKIDRSTRKGNY